MKVYKMYIYKYVWTCLAFLHFSLASCDIDQVACIVTKIGPAVYLDREDEDVCRVLLLLSLITTIFLELHLEHRENLQNKFH